MLVDDGAVVMQKLIFSVGTVNYCYMSCNRLMGQQCTVCHDTSFSENTLLNIVGNWRERSSLSTTKVCLC